MGFFDSIGSFFSGVGDAVSSIVNTVSSTAEGFFHAVTSGDTNILETLALGAAAIYAPELLPELEVMDDINIAASFTDAEVAGVESEITGSLESDYATMIQDYAEVNQEVPSMLQSTLDSIQSTVTDAFKSVTTTISDYTGAIKANISMITTGNLLEPILSVAESLGVEVDVGTWMTAATIDEYVSAALEPVFAAVKAFNDITKGVFQDVMNLAQAYIKPIIGMIQATRGDVSAILGLYDSQISELYKQALTLNKMIIEIQQGKYLSAVYDYIKLADADLATQIQNTVRYFDDSLLTLRNEITGAVKDISNLARDTQKAASVTLGTAGALVNAFGMASLASKLKDIDTIDNDFFLSITGRLKLLNDHTEAAFATTRMPFISFIQAALADDRTFNNLSPFYSTFSVRSLNRAMTDYQKAQPKPAWMVLKR